MLDTYPHVRALIFDCDGTLVDTMPLHYLAWRDTVAAADGYFPERLFYELGGVRSERIVEILNEKFGWTMDPDKVAADKERLFVEKYLPQTRPIDTVVDIARNHEGILPMAVATGGIPSVIHPLLRSVGILHLFDAVVTADDVKHGKPAPDIFLEAARRLEVPPKHCLVFEDSDAGLEGACRAGMVAIDVRPWRSRREGSLRRLGRVIRRR